jgi:hypothetical protein
MTEYVTATALAAHLGCSRVTIHDYVARKVFQRLPNGKFDQNDCRLKAFAYLRDKAGGRTGSSDNNLSQARAELAREQTTAVALKNAIARGEVAPLREIKRQLEVVFTAFRERTLAIPGKIAAVCEMRSRGEVEEIVREECYEALEELSRPILPVGGPAGVGGAMDAEDDEEGEV